MKKLNILATIFGSILPICSLSEEIKSQKKDNTRFQTASIYENKPYTTGGVTFHYPTCIFNSPPDVNITIEETPFNIMDTYVTEIIESTNESITIMAFLVVVTEGIVSLEEAGNGVITISLLATETH
jgi:hypothetical protein